MEHKRKLDSNDKCVVIGNIGLILSYFTPDINFKFKDEFKLYHKYPELMTTEEKQMFNSDDILNNFDTVLDNYYLSDYTESSPFEYARKYGEDLDGFYLAWSKAYGGNMSFNRKLCSEPLVYDTNYKGYGIEDIDFSYQLFLQEFKFCVCSEAKNFHQEHPRNKYENRDMFRNFEYFYQKYQDINVQMVKMDWDNQITLDEGNLLLTMLHDYKSLVGKNIIKQLETDSNQ